MKTHRGEVWLGYRIQSWRVEYIYKRSDKIRFDNKKWDYEHNIKAVWSYDKNWSPYGEQGNVSMRPSSDERQTRLRVGIQCVFFDLRFL